MIHRDPGVARRRKHETEGAQDYRDDSQRPRKVCDADSEPMSSALEGARPNLGRDVPRPRRRRRRIPDHCLSA